MVLRGTVREIQVVVGTVAAAHVNFHFDDVVVATDDAQNETKTYF